MFTIKNDLKNSVLLLFVTVATYWSSWNAFFQQDEWAGLGAYFSRLNEPFSTQVQMMYEPLLSQGFAHLLPWVIPFNYIRYAFFGLDYAPYAYLSLFLHIVATILVYKLVLQTTRNCSLSLWGSLFFAVSSASSQAVLWVSTSIPTQCALIFSVLAVSSFHRWLTSGGKSKLIVSFIYLILAVGFKETALFLFLIMPAMGVIYRPDLKEKNVRWFFVGGGTYVLLRILALSGDGGFFEAFRKTVSMIIAALQNYVSVAVRGTAQLVIPQNVMMNVIDRFMQKVPDIFNSVAKDAPIMSSPDTVTKGLLYIIGGVFIVTSVILARSYYKRKSKEPLMFVLFFLFSFLPLSFIPASELGATYLPSRGLYIPAVAFFVVVYITIGSFVRNKTYLYLILLPFIVLNFFDVRNSISEFIEIGDERRSILNQFSELSSDLPPKVVFYTESDRSYYGLPTDAKIMPFQSGFGQTLLVWFYPREKYSELLFRDSFLWEITSEGYREVDGYGFGYFRDIKKLEEVVEENNLEDESIIAVSWDGDTKILSNISGQIRQQIR